jgi:hypothetical protein
VKCPNRLAWGKENENDKKSLVTLLERQDSNENSKKKEKNDQAERD